MFISLNNWFNPHVFFEQPPRHTATTHGPPAATWSHGASCTGARGTRGHQVHQGGSLRCRASNGKSWGNNGNIQKLMFIIYSWENHLYIILYIYIYTGKIHEISIAMFDDQVVVGYDVSLCISRTTRVNLEV